MTRDTEVIAAMQVRMPRKRLSGQMSQDRPLVTMGNTYHKK